MITRKNRKLVIKDDDINKDLKLELRGFLEIEIKYIVNKIFMRILLWILFICVPVIVAWSLAEYKRSEVIRDIEDTWLQKDSAVHILKDYSYNTLRQNILLKEMGEDIKRLDRDKVDIEFLNGALIRINRQLDRSREFETEILKRQDIMLQYLLDIKKDLP